MWGLLEFLEGFNFVEVGRFYFCIIYLYIIFVYRCEQSPSISFYYASITQISPFPSLIAALPLTNVECDYPSKLLPVKCDWLAQASQAQVEQEGAGTTWDSGLSHGEPPQDGTLPFSTPVVP